MIVKNIECQNAEFIEMIIKQLTENNINYLLIKNESYIELHFDNYIYKFFCLVCIENIDETLDLHKPYIDNVHLKCEKCGKAMTRIPDVLDCWFDSGAMPFAQYHYPFENK